MLYIVTNWQHPHWWIGPTNMQTYTILLWTKGDQSHSMQISPAICWSTSCRELFLIIYIITFGVRSTFCFPTTFGNVLTFRYIFSPSTTFQPAGHGGNHLAGRSSHYCKVLCKFWSIRNSWFYYFSLASVKQQIIVFFCQLLSPMYVCTQ